MAGQSALRPHGKDWFWVLAFLGPTLLGLVLGTFGSVFAVLALSFFDWDLLTPANFIGTDNYTGLASDRFFVRSLWNTVAFSALYVPLTLLLSLGAALLLNRKISGVSLFRVLFFLPVISSPTAVGLLWTWILAEDRGVLNGVLGFFGVDPVGWLNSNMILYSVVMVNVWGAIGEGMIIFLAGLQAIPKDFYEAGRIEGASAWQRLRYITLPALAPSLFFQSVLATIHAFQAFDYIYILTRLGNGNSSFPTLVFSMYRTGFRFFRMGDAAAQAIVLTLIIFLLTLLYFRIQKRFETP
jgi:multiple sugar transport system permease protein